MVCMFQAEQLSGLQNLSDVTGVTLLQYEHHSTNNGSGCMSLDLGVQWHSFSAAATVPHTQVDRGHS